MSRIDRVGRRVQEAFAGAPRNERLHVAGRLRSCPLDAVAAATPREGDILDFGCGHGAVTLYLAFDSPSRHLTGVDVDDDKIALARVAAKAAAVDVTFERVEPDFRPAGTWDAIVVVDVLYLLGPDAAFEVLDAAVASLAPGGTLVVKEVDVRPRWKYWLAHTQEVLATRLLRITEGSRVHFVPPDRLGARLEASGLTVEHRPCHRGRLHPHHLIVARKSADA